MKKYITLPCIFIITILIVGIGRCQNIECFFSNELTSTITTEWGDKFTTRIKARNSDPNTFDYIVYDKDNNKITYFTPLEGMAGFLDPQDDYPNGIWMLPILNNDEVRSYLYFGIEIVYFDKESKKYYYWDPFGMEIPDKLYSSVDKSLELYSKFMDRENSDHFKEKIQQYKNITEKQK